ncbi:hypothetical protein [Gordonia sp. ABSL49_1]|uniref:hypothetical protein n=1 Tax=Gordonia sp. ABSL49_1 TaxID=2920941 RepID=UPI001F0CED78|nr:hypothetical protein [Gordonia sp. ABSL49_1]MCH5643419.1 hypothetical protein [Gordonia sp. ABSL49_1]
MTAVHEPCDLLEAATDEDRDAAIADALANAGLTLDELTAQARTGSFDSFKARLAWVVVGGVHR